MNALDWLQVDKVFQATVELDALRRAAFLDVACAGDPMLRSEVESLLTADSHAWDLIDTPALESAAILLEDGAARLMPGEEVGHYEILKLIGKGGMGEVYLARDRILNRNIALKLLPFYYTQNDDRLRRFQREAQAASALNHPNIITIHELGIVNDQQFIATEFIEGDTLRQHIERGPLSLLDAIDIAIQTASALAAAHNAGIVHRDIKPENIMLRPDGYVKVLDFGLAKLAERSEPRLEVAPGVEPPDLSSGILMGTLRYMSPEQASGSAVDVRSDIFSLGVVFYEMIAGRPPFENKSVAKRVGSILNDEPHSLPDTSQHAHAQFAAIIDKALQKDLQSRYQDAGSLLLDLKLLKDELNDQSRLSKGAAALASPRSFIGKTGVAVILLALLSAIFLLGFAFNNSLQPTSAVSTRDTEPLLAGTWTSIAPISSARYHVEPAVLHGKLYAVGGWNVCTPFANLESYDPGRDTWTQHAPMRTARGAHGVGVLNGLLYAVGGSVDCGVHTASVEAYDPATNAWSKRSSLPIERTGHVVAVANGKLYAFGGQTVHDNDTSLNTEYDPIADRWTERAALPTARSGSAVAVLNDIIYVIGGSFSHRSLPTVEAYNPRNNTWTTRTPMRSPRAFHAASALGGLIYAFGGSDSEEVEVYDPVTDTWEVAGKMPTRRAQFHAETFEGSIYFAGGYDRGNYLSTVMAFRPDSVWEPRTEKCPMVRETTKAPMSTARSGMAVGGIEGIIYVAGGYDRDSGYLAINEAYDPVSDEWRIKSPMPTARTVLGTNTAVVDGKLYVIGGNAKGYCTNANEAYDPSTDRWTARAPMPTARCHLAVIALNGLVYTFGGTNTNGSIRYSVLEIYDPSTDAWTTGSPMPTARNYMGAVALSGIIYAIGGWNPTLTPDGELDVVEAYDPGSGTWTTKAPLPAPRSGVAVGALDGTLIVVGGERKKTVLAAVEAYDPTANSWSTLTNLSNTRFFHSAISLNNALYTFGGRRAPYLDESVRTTEAITLSRCQVE